MMTTEDLKARGWRSSHAAPGVYWDSRNSVLRINGTPVMLHINGGTVGITGESYSDDLALGIPRNTNYKTFDTIEAALVYLKLQGNEV